MAEAAQIHAQSDPTTQERRKEHRQRVLLGGKLVHSNTAFSMDCVLRNLSPFGARVVIPVGAVVPDQFELIEMKSGAVYGCRVVWREYPQIGVTFESNALLMQADTPRLMALKRLWLDSQLR